MMKAKSKITSPKGALAIAPSFNSGIKCDGFIERCTQQPTFEIIGIIASQRIDFSMEQKNYNLSSNFPLPTHNNELIINKK